METIRIRALARRDLPEVLAIERASFAAPWSEADFDGVLRCQRVFALAAECDGELCGYLVGECEGGRVQMLDLAVDVHARRRGVAARLVREVARQLHGRQRLVTIVGERNLAGQLFYRSQGFRAVTILQRLWQTDEDGYLFEYRPGERHAPFMPANRVAAYL